MSVVIVDLRQHAEAESGTINDENEPHQDDNNEAEESEVHLSREVATSHVFEMEQDEEKETLLSSALPQKEEQPRTSTRRESVLRSLTSRGCYSFLGGGMVLLLVIGVPLAYRRTPKEVNSLDINDIHNWCLEEGRTDCDCPNPLLPSPRQPPFPKWTKMHEKNVQKAESAADTDIDVVFLGDSITEGWSGTSIGTPREDKRANVPVFSSFFDPNKGGEFSGLVLGIAGDKSPNLAWRLQNGEAPPNLRPRVWWVLIGTNDFQRNDPKCSEEVVLMGIQRVLLELKRRARNGDTARVVVNSLLPRSDDNQERRLTTKRLDDGGRTVWSAIQKVNDELERLCEETPGWEFFNATHIFARKLDAPPEKEVDSPYYIPERLMADQLHPTAKGYKHWGGEIVKQLHSLLDE